MFEHLRRKTESKVVSSVLEVGQEFSSQDFKSEPTQDLRDSEREVVELRQYVDRVAQREVVALDGDCQLSPSLQIAAANFCQCRNEVMPDRRRIRVTQHRNYTR